MSKLNLKGLRLFKKKNDKTYLKQKDTVDVMELAEETIVEDDDIIIKGQPETGDLVRIKASDFFAKVEDEIGELNSALTDIPLVQYGTIAITLSGEDYKDYSVTFSKTFSSTPVVITGLSNSATNVNYAYLAFTVISRSTTGFTVRVLNSYNGSPTPTLAWIAVGGA